ncbi:unnamed protein product [Cochlearia groenlandica]
MCAIIVDFQRCFIFTLLCFFSLLCYYVLFKKPKKSNLESDLPPSPPSLPIIGHLHHLLLSVLSHKSFQRISTMHDLNISSSRGITAIDESLVFGSSSFLTSRYGDYWKRTLTFMKKLLAAKLLRPEVVEKSRGVREEELRRFYSNIRDKAMKKESVEVCKEAMKFANNMICRMTMGRSCSEENGEAEKIRELIIRSFSFAKKMFFAYLFRRLGISLFKKEIMGVSNTFDELLERILVEHEEKLGDDQDKDLMDLLLEAYRDEKAEYKITRNHIKSLFVDIFLAGTDTSAQTIEWVMAEIINKPNILERLRDEIDLVLRKTRMIQETDLPNLPYLQAVVKEGLRLHPPGPILMRKFDKSCAVNGFYVPEKTTLIINVYAIMRDPDSWEEPDEFKPERFLASSSKRREKKDEIREQNLKYLPFGAGRRGCPGENLGYIFLETAIGMMVQCFDWKITGDNHKVNMEESISGIILTMAHPLKCTPVSRLDTFTL